MNGATLIAENKDTRVYSCPCGLIYTYPKASNYQPNTCVNFPCAIKVLHPELEGKPLRWLPQTHNTSAEA